MKWSAILTLGLVLMALFGLVIWGYQFFVAPESVESVTAKWAESGHADRTSPSFTNWDSADPPQVPQNCAKCHSLYGYLDFLGEDGSAAGQVEGPAKLGSVVTCNACHNVPAHALTTVQFPSSIDVEALSGAANCMQCHQGRAATSTVERAIANLEPDAVGEGLQFINVHYGIAAATLLGGDAQVGYQYPGKRYVGQFAHVEDYASCVQCHDAHSTALDANMCSPCHLNVVDVEDLKDIRQSTVDYDGDGDVSEPVAQEIAALHSALYTAILDYSAAVIGTPIVYEKNTFPYFFVDTNANGVADGEEASFGNRYLTWTPRLVRTVYNYNYVNKDRGAYAHNPAYVLQLLYDSLADLHEVQAVAGLERFVRP